MHSSMPEHPQDREAEGNARSKKEGLIYQYTAKKKKKMRLGIAFDIDTFGLFSPLSSYNSLPIFLVNFFPYPSWYSRQFNYLRFSFPHFL